MKFRGIFILFVIAITAYVLYEPYSTSYDISRSAGAVLSQNWVDSFLWLKYNTPNCTVIATYWDPGHFITGIAERPVVFDGASQNQIRKIEVEGNLSEEEIKKIAVIPNYNVEFFEKDGKPYTRIITARIQDIGTSLFTSNETIAVDLMRKYLIPGCNSSMYYIASSDLIGKSQWWTYFSTWRREDKTGEKYFYYPVALAQRRPSITDNSTIYVYPLAQNQAFLIYEKNDTLAAYYQTGKDMVKIKRLFYFKENYGLMQISPDGEDALIWLSPGMEEIIFVPSELVNSMFTTMFLFNGEGLKKFEFVRSFGGEVKIFKVNFD